MKATFDILRRWSYPLVPEIIASMHKQSLSTIPTPTSPQIKLNDPYLSFYNVNILEYTRLRLLFKILQLVSLRF